ncbi:MAG: hypothetical protein Q7R73_02705 [bacterium]|nr:hypothetical protein [bacterium]
MKAFRLRGKENGFEYGILLAKSLDGLVEMLGATKADSPFPNEFRLPKGAFSRIHLKVGEWDKKQVYSIEEVPIISY